MQENKYKLEESILDNVGENASEKKLVRNNPNDDSEVECSVNGTETVGKLPKANFVLISYHECQISKLPPSSFIVSAFQNLNIFNISHIGLESIHPIYGASILDTVLASHNNLTEITAGLFPVLINLDLSSNRINRIDSLAFSNLAKLEVLNLSWNNLTSIQSSTFSNLTNLKLLDLSHNQLVNLNAETFGHLINLEVLNLSSNLIEKMDNSTFDALPKLKHLDLSNLNFSELEMAIFSHLYGLKSLNLTNNNLKRVHFDLFSPALKKLEMFYVDGNRLEDLDGFDDSNFTNLHIFSIAENRFNCSYLQMFLNSIENKTLKFTTENTIQVHKTNIRGISCKDGMRGMELESGSLSLLCLAILTIVIFIIMIRYKINKANGRIAIYEVRGETFDNYRKKPKASFS